MLQHNALPDDDAEADALAAAAVAVCADLGKGTISHGIVDDKGSFAAELLSGDGVLPTTVLSKDEPSPDAEVPACLPIAALLTALSKVEPSPGAEMLIGTAECDSPVALVTTADDSSMLPEEVRCGALPRPPELRPLPNDEPGGGSQQVALAGGEESDESFQPLALQGAEAEGVHGMFLHAEAEGLVETLVEHTKNLNDLLLEEHASTTQWLSALRGEVLKPHTNRKAKAKRRNR